MKAMLNYYEKRYETDDLPIYAETMDILIALETDCDVTRNKCYTVRDTIFNEVKILNDEGEIEWYSVEFFGKYDFETFKEAHSIF